MDKKKDVKNIRQLWLPGDGNSHDHSYTVGRNGVKQIYMQNKFHGDHDEDWIHVITDSGISTLNPRQITEIVWSQNEN